VGNTGCSWLSRDLHSIFRRLILSNHFETAEKIAAHPFLSRQFTFGRNNYF